MTSAGKPAQFTSPGRFRSVKEFRDYFLDLDPEMGCDLELEAASGPCGRPIEVHSRVLENRFATQPMEGWDARPDGLPSRHTLRRWRNFGRSGAKLIWGGEAFAVREDGRANPNQLYDNRHAAVEGGLVELREAVGCGHREVGEVSEGLFIGLQLTHSGRWARPGAGASGPQPRIAYHHPILDAWVGLSAGAQVLTDMELEGIAESFVRAAGLARDAGFDFVDIKCCHGYLLHELLGARARSGRYGGAFSGRSRLFRGIVEEIQQSYPELAVAVRVSICDSFPFQEDPKTGTGAAVGLAAHLPYEHGFGIDKDRPLQPDLEEPVQFLELCRELGIQVVNITVGSPYYSAHLQRPAAYPPSDAYPPPMDPLLAVAYHLRTVRACKKAVPDLLLVGSGYSYLQEYLPHVAQYELRCGHVDFVGLGRMCLSYPEMPLDVLQGRALDKKRICRTLSDCTTAPRNGLPSGCYPLDPYYRELPEAARLKQAKLEGPS